MPAKEKLATTSRNLATREFQKHPFISSAFRLPRMHRATRDKHVIKETRFIGQTYWESYSIIQQISPNSHWWFITDISLISHMMWEIIACYDFSDHMRNRRWYPISYDFPTISVFTPPWFLGEKSPVWIRQKEPSLDQKNKKFQIFSYICYVYTI